ncbi:LamG-like jellyroll fold domain-containing protein [Pontimicrobium aquaticum]|uniref:T9SS type A sorting domain-containing protein n=1 Tax=Pontimicrobium aquaticum TaxID=2565367 RepID=A0A4U0F100_9FLAO|nr:LamG-like jellyroll fold domain-containing protein [Pontimicrobium aquaticum]TJY37918.1 T9SS type A sorting domain-containing protein [Pontimicrobium aquaticum]
MKRALIFKTLYFNTIVFLLLFCSTVYSQTMQLEVVGGAVVTQGSTISITAGASLDFRITNVSTTSCKNLKIQDVDIFNTVDFDINPNNPKRNIKPYSCRGGKKFLDFEIENISPSCATASTLVTVEIKNQPDFTFTLEVTSSPEIYVLGGNPWQDINHGDTTTSDTNATYFGVLDEGNTVTRNFIVANIGSCSLDVTALASSNNDFAVTWPYGTLPVSLDPYYYTVISVTFTAPVAGTGTQSSVISISNTDNTTFTFTVSAEMFNFNIPGPGGITADFRLWLKSTRGVVTSGLSVTDWLDLGTNGKDATTVVGKEPTYLDTATDNINFNPVIKFENDGGVLEQYMYNNSNGFYSQDIFIVMTPDATITNASAKNTIFAGIDSGAAGDITGIGFGDYSSEFTNETLSYNQNYPGILSYHGEAELNSSYEKAGIINVRNNASILPTGQDILYNSNVLTTSTKNSLLFSNVGYTDILPPFTVHGTRFWIGRNYDIQGSLNGRVAEIFTFAERLSDADRQKVESYLGIKYGITLGASTEATKDYINSFNTKVWDATANAGYNYHVAGIGRDSISDLNQKQSKSINYANAVTIGLGGVATTNSANPNEFVADGDFLVWGNNNGAFTGANNNTVTIATGVTTTLTRIDRQWKIVESIESGSGGDIETVYVSIPSVAFSSFTKTADEEYALIVADNANFANGDIIDVIPLRSDGGTNLETWYNFDGTKYFTFGKTSKLTENHSINIASGDYLVGDYLLNLNTDNFTISAWLKIPANASNRTVMAKGDKLQIRLNATGNVEVYIDDPATPKFTSNMDIDDGKWHHTTYVYDSGTLLMYVDGVLDKSVQNVVHPSPNYNHYAIGALYTDKDTVTNPLLGDIDEVYVWDIALSQDQVRYLMNQEIERFDIAGTDYVEGKILPQAAINNPTDTIPWSSLRVYYDFNSFYGSTIEGLTDDRYFLRLNYLNKTKTILDDQTTPLPYVSVANGAWDAGTTWSNSADQIIPNSLSLDGSTIIDWNIVEIAHDITSGDRDITLLGLKQTAGTLTIADPVVTAPIENNAGQALTVTNYLEIDGVIDLVGESQLIQTDGSIIDADSGGHLERDQQGTANGFNYNYWSSSVGPVTGNAGTRGTGTASTNANHTISGVLNDGTNSAAYQGLTYDAAHTAADSDTPTTPRTLSTYWMYKFYGSQDNYDAWTPIDETSLLLAGEGFTMKGTSGSVTIVNNQNYVFKGLPNNGDITLPLDKSSGDVERLIGNPYPSAIDAREFILDHLSENDGGNNTVNVINGAVYFWDHFGEENSHYLRDYVGGYATYNLTGGTPAISNDTRINNTSDGGNAAIGTKVPGQYIPVNQGFFVLTALDSHPDNNTPSANISTIAGGNIVFKNTQRVFVTEQDASSSFLRTSGKKKSNKPNTSTNKVAKDTPSIRIIYDSPKGYHRQLLLGVNNNASKGFDLGYDAFMVDVNKEDMYWTIGAEKFVIQGVDDLNNTQEFPLGLVVDEAGVISIRIKELKNIDPRASIYVKDKETNESFKINNDVFNLKLKAGIYNDRFLLVFKAQEYSINNEVLEINHGLLAYYDSNISKIRINNINDIDLNKLTIYNIAGQELSVHSIDASTNQVAINVSHGVYVLKFNTSSHGVIDKKIIVR